MPEAPRLAVITGGTRGLGRALSLAAARAGMDVLAVYRSNESAAQALLQEGVGLPGRIQCVRHDLAGPDFPAPPGTGSLVFIHAAAAPFRPSSLHLLANEDFQEQWRTAVLGLVNGLRALLRPMVRAGGGTVVIVLTSALDEAPPKGFAAYSAAKAALRELARSLGAEYSAQGVRTLCDSPGFMETGFTAAWGERFCDAVRTNQAGGALEPEAVAARIWQLINDPSLPAQGENYPLT